MMDNPVLVEFLPEDPPSAAKGERTLPLAWLGYVTAVLEARPGQWAKIHGVPTDNAAQYASRLTERAAELGVNVEAVGRRGVLYAKCLP